MARPAATGATLICQDLVELYLNIVSNVSAFTFEGTWQRGIGKLETERELVEASPEDWDNCFRLILAPDDCAVLDEVLVVEECSPIAAEDNGPLHMRFSTQNHSHRCVKQTQKSFQIGGKVLRWKLL